MKIPVLPNMSPVTLGVIVTLLLLCATASNSASQTYTSLFSFNHTDGSAPYYMSLVQGLDGNFYGTTENGGSNGFGTVFKVTPSGSVTTLYNFEGFSDGGNPYPGLVLAADGNFYGTALFGGNANSHSGNGTVFQITPGGTFRVLHQFVGGSSDGANPYSGLVQGTDGKLYGTTSAGGSTNNGTVFAILTTGGSVAILHSFTGNGDGLAPFAGLALGADGNFYGTTEGGNTEDGTVFKITTSGTLTTLHSFSGSDGDRPYGVLVQGTDGNWYGTTSSGGTNFDGTVFKISTSGTLTTIHDFANSDGIAPYGALSLASDGNFYGTTFGGGVNDLGTAFKMTSAGSITTLHSFGSSNDGSDVYPGLLQSTSGTFFGATESGGTNGNGTLFSLANGLTAFVKTVPSIGPVGTSVKILGTNLTGSTSVTFGGVAATFTVVSSTEITTKVPTGATSGLAKVKTPSTTLSTVVNFTVN